MNYTFRNTRPMWSMPQGNLRPGTGAVPTLMSESGRAITAYHAVTIVESWG